MQVLHHVRAGQAEQVIVALQRLAVVGETFAAEVLFAEVQLLHHDAGGAVEHQDARLGGGVQSGDAVTTIH